jgi:hypothetical protein
VAAAVAAAHGSIVMIVVNFRPRLIMDAKLAHEYGAVLDEGGNRLILSDIRDLPRLVSLIQARGGYVSSVTMPPQRKT